METIIDISRSTSNLHENVIFQDVANIIIDTVNSFSSQKKEAIIHFKGCEFKFGFKIGLNVYTNQFKSIELIFEDCIISNNDDNEQIIQPKEQIKVSIKILNSIIDSLRLSNCKLDSLLTSRTIFTNRLIINKCESYIQLINATFG